MENTFHSIGPWKATYSIRQGRRNLFETRNNAEFHICTMVSSSWSQLPKFYWYVDLIEKTPEMYNLLNETITLLDRHYDQSESFLQLRQKISECIDS